MRQLWQCIYGNDHPVEIEIGPGTGTFILPAARSHPQTNFLGIEHSRTRAARLESLCVSAGLHNVRVIAADAACVIAHIVPTSSVSAYHVYFPDPWWKRRHQRRRLVTPAFAAALARTLVVGGQLHIATDVDHLLQVILSSLAGVAPLRPDPMARSPRQHVTVFERKGLARGARIHEVTFVKQPHQCGDHTSSAAPMTPAESPS